MASSDRAPYDLIANEWDGVRAENRGRESHYLDLLLETAPQGSTILDLGCGSGRPNAVEIAARGYRVVGVDRSAELLRLAKMHVPEGVWIEADMTTLRLGEQFAGVICWDALFHIERKFVRGILENIFHCLLPGGRVALSCGGSAFDIPAFTADMFGQTFFYDAWPKDQMIELVHEVGFEIVLAEMIEEADGEENKGKLGIVAVKK